MKKPPEVEPETGKVRAAHAPLFEAFWAAWPKNTGRYSRKGGKAACLAVWNKRYHFTQADQIIKHVEWLKTTEAWLKDSGAYIPAPLVYLNQQRWDGAEIPSEEEVVEAANPEVARTKQWLAEQARRSKEPPSNGAGRAAFLKLLEKR